MSQQSDRLLKVILDSRLTYKELEKRTGIAKSSIQRYATGSTKKIPIDAVKSIADATNSSASWIMNWEDDVTYLDDIDADEIIGRINDRAKEKGLDIDEVLSACNIEINSFVEFSKKAVSLADCLDCAIDYIMGRSDSVNIPKLGDAEVSIDELLNTVGRKALLEELLKREDN